MSIFGRKLPILTGELQILSAEWLQGIGAEKICAGVMMFSRRCARKRVGARNFLLAHVHIRICARRITSVQCQD